MEIELKHPSMFVFAPSKLIKGITCLLMLLVAQVSYAQEEALTEIAPKDEYQIEFILFKQSAPDFSVLEFERFEGAADKSAQQQFLYTYGHEALGPHQAVISSDAELSLAGSTSKLRAKAYSILSAGAWQQVVDKDTRTEALNLNPEPPLESNFWLSATAQDQGFYPRLPNTGPRIMIAEAVKESFSGWLSIKRSRYIHAELELDYHIMYRFQDVNWFTYLASSGQKHRSLTALLSPMPSESFLHPSTWIPVHSFKFKDSRRIKDKQIHYLDHPYLGLIVTVQKIKKEELY